MQEFSYTYLNHNIFLRSINIVISGTWKKLLPNCVLYYHSFSHTLFPQKKFVKIVAKLQQCVATRKNFVIYLQSVDEIVHSDIYL